MDADEAAIKSLASKFCRSDGKDPDQFFVDLAEVVHTSGGPVYPFASAKPAWTLYRHYAEIAIAELVRSKEEAQ